MHCIVHDYPLQAYCIEGHPNFNETSYRKTFSSFTKQKLRCTCTVYYVMQMTGGTLPATGRDLIFNNYSSSPNELRVNSP